MKIDVSRRDNWENEPKTSEEIELATCEALIDCTDFFRVNTIRIGEEGIYLMVKGKVHMLTIDINFVRTLGEDEEVPVTFVPDGE